jgi:hypothetical protein
VFINYDGASRIQEYSRIQATGILQNPDNRNSAESTPHGYSRNQATGIQRNPTTNSWQPEFSKNHRQQEPTKYYSHSTREIQQNLVTENKENPDHRNPAESNYRKRGKSI